MEISLIKFHGATMLHNVIDRAVQVHGALGVTSDRPLDKMYREARYARLYDGPDEVHHMVVARNLLRNYKDCTVVMTKTTKSSSSPTPSPSPTSPRADGVSSSPASGRDGRALPAQAGRASDNDSGGLPEAVQQRSIRR